MTHQALIGGSPCNEKSWKVPRSGDQGKPPCIFLLLPNVYLQPMTRAPRQLLTGWVEHSRPNGRCPEATWDRTLNGTLKCKELLFNSKEWRAIAEGRSEWRSRTYSKPMPPSENWSCRVHESKDEHCITQNGTQPSQTCSGGMIDTQLCVFCCCIFANRIVILSNRENREIGPSILYYGRSFPLDILKIRYTLYAISVTTKTSRHLYFRELGEHKRFRLY